MISVCIPIYNYSVKELVETLIHQARTFMVPIEVLLIDDCSSIIEFHHQNCSLASSALVSYKRLDKNIGRSAIRNLFEQEANYQHLLFLDCDTVPASTHFIQTYAMARLQAQIVVGGILYRDHLSDDTSMLRWTYGHLRETKSVAQRSLKPYSSFMSGNFMIDRSILKSVKFDESISKYGHEDTLFGIELNNNNVSILHVHAPVFHDGLEDNNQFIAKTKVAVQTLHQLYLTHSSREMLIRDISLLRVFHQIQKMFLTGFFVFVYGIIKWGILMNLRGLKPRMICFDLYKLGEFCLYDKKKEHHS